MQTLLQTLQDANRREVALGHFNISELVTLKAVCEVAQELGTPVIIGVSESERAFIGTREVAALVKAIREDTGAAIFLNADHVHTLSSAEDAARAGFDLVVFDASKAPFEQNVAATKAALTAVKSIRRETLVEGEIGYIGSGSQIQHQAVARPLTTPTEASQFVAATGVDLLAPAVGNMHGMLRTMVSGEDRQHLDVSRIAAIKQATGLFLTLHGGSGTDDTDLREAIKAGITVVHISTELRIAFRRGLETALAGHSDEVAPYTLLQPSLRLVAEVVRQRVELFNSSQSSLQM
jgi:fructose-bisphosphate aldolase class II